MPLTPLPGMPPGQDVPPTAPDEVEPKPMEDVEQLIVQIRDLLDRLETAVAGPKEEPVEFEPQSDDEIVAGLAPKQKTVNGPPGAL